MENKTGSAYLLIDMQNAFIDSGSTLCIKNARSTIPACVRTVTAAREKGIPVFFVQRQYRPDGSDVEFTRRAAWEAGGRPLAPGSESGEAPEGLRPLPGDYTIIKPRWSGFFGTELDLVLRRLGVRTVILAGTTTPNCIRTTCYDAIALDYDTVVIEDCCSSQNDEIQRVNLADMRNIGARIITAEDFMNF
jgi:nicotinamidase-related amidase